jgi:hypothetical protein
MVNIFRWFDFKEVLIHIFIVFVVVFLLDLFIYPIAMRIYSKLSFLMKNDIESVVMITEPASTKNTYIYAADRVQIYKDFDKSQKIIVESLMQQQNHDGFENFILQKNEVALSENVMSAYKLKTGDHIYIELLNVLEKSVIKFVLPANYGMIGNPMLACGTAIIGYNPEFETRLKIKYVLFSEVNFNDLSNNIRIRTEYKRDYRDYFLLFFVWLIVLYSLYLAVLRTTYVLLNNLLKEDYTRQISYFYSLGLSSTTLIFLALSLPVLLVFMPMVLGLVICIIILFEYALNFYCIFSFIVLSLLASVIWTLRIIRCYRSAGKLTIWKNY